MDRVISYVGSIALVEDFLNAQRNAVIAVGHALAAPYGQSQTAAHGFVPAVGPGLQFIFDRGSLIYPEVVDQSAYGVLAANPSTIIMQAISQGLTFVNVIADNATYVVAAAGNLADDTLAVLDFYNPANPMQAFAGPNNSNGLLPTRRPAIAVLQLFRANAVPAGWVPLYDIQVPVGTTQVDMTMLRADPAAPVFMTIPQLQAALAQETANRFAAQAQVLLETRADVWSPMILGSIYNGSAIQGYINPPAWATIMEWRGVAAGGGGGAAGVTKNGGGGGGGATGDGWTPVTGGIPYGYSIGAAGSAGAVTAGQGTSGGSLVIGDITLHGGIGGYGGAHGTFPSVGGDGGGVIIAAKSAFVGKVLSGGPGNDGGWNIGSGCGIGGSSSGWGLGGRASTALTTGYAGGVGGGGGGSYNNNGPGGEGGQGALQWKFKP